MTTPSLYEVAALLRQQQQQLETLAKSFESIAADVTIPDHGCTLAEAFHRLQATMGGDVYARISVNVTHQSAGKITVEWEVYHDGGDIVRGASLAEALGKTLRDHRKVPADTVAHVDKLLNDAVPLQF